MAFAIQPKQKILFIGDSVTDCNRRGEHRPLGHGYVRMVSDLITARYPRHQCKVINTGCGGDTIRKLFDRWTDDCIQHQPDWLSIMIGVNDNVSWLCNTPHFVESKEYEQIYETLLGRVKTETKARLVLMTPFHVSQARRTDEDGWRGRVNKSLPLYVKAVERIARRHKARLVHTQAMFDAQLKLHDPYEFCDEPVHPNATGHLLVAHEWLKAMGW